MREQGWASCCLLRVNEVVRVGFGGRGGDECEKGVGPDIGDSRTCCRQSLGLQPYPLV
jgi:hypothetical protein